MTRGIHLKHLTATDLGLLGLPQELLESEGASADHQELAAEGDPALARITQEVRVTLEDALALLDEALALGSGPVSALAPALGLTSRPSPPPA
jgi:hypothetical protein